MKDRTSASAFGCRASAKFICFDVMVVLLITLLAASGKLLGTGEGSLFAPECPAADDDDAKQIHHEPSNNHTRTDVAPTITPDADVPPEAPIPSDDHEDTSYLQIGNVVELGAGYFAPPAVVRGFTRESGSVTYHIHNAITERTHRGVSAEFLRPYQIYDKGTKASCNVSHAPREMFMVPCTVQGHYVKKKSGFVSYQVSFLNVDKVRVETVLPFSRVQREERQ